MDHTFVKVNTGLLLAVDYVKAFDTIRWDLIYEAHEIFDISYMHLFKDVKSCICNAGLSSDFFSPERGVRQGCCSSNSLFILTIELLSIMVLESIEICSLNVAWKTFKISQYADDALLIPLEKFSTLSGLRINTHKSHLLLLGIHFHPLMM